MNRVITSCRCIGIRLTGSRPEACKLLTALAGIAAAAGSSAAAAPLLLAIDEPQHLFADPGVARKFAAAVKLVCGGAGGGGKQKKLTLMMTTETIKNIETLFGRYFLYSFENHIVLRGGREQFYEPKVFAERLRRGAAIPIINALPQPPISRLEKTVPNF